MTSHGLAVAMDGADTATQAALRPDGAVDVKAVEDHTAALLWQHWQTSVHATCTPMAANVHDTVLQALANQVCCHVSLQPSHISELETRRHSSCSGSRSGSLFILRNQCGGACRRVVIGQ